MGFIMKTYEDFLDIMIKSDKKAKSYWFGYVQALKDNNLIVDNGYYLEIIAFIETMDK